ncbi:MULTISPECIES: hypothetical protein [Klebsiella/Raoultella group]|jgi:hypothetical protein|uniref:Transmembrane protein n=1 Tax=Raoultella terrigena TaxID=577 RepID=A0AAP9XV31_RAOTE|nr:MULTISPECIES: hypothetical protein [Klebsiella/Raoultella group]MBL6016625.1 hypothetical protein [Klebsiella pneumoniae]EJG2383430.1 hypothetical protein [Raoultella ornithinolytica]ELS4497101.1 hypothetical protein [Klebsiella michiganensis]ELS4629655.1 hypothetical protein [Klebsiella michiganensis]MBL6258621.1 hypothetical protein [Klebsiella pneumoniae]
MTKRTDDSAQLRQAMGGSAKTILLVAAGIAGVMLILAAVFWLSDLVVMGLTTVWPRHAWVVSITACGAVWCVLVMSEFIRLTLNGAGLMRKEKYDVWIGLYFGVVMILSWALCAALFWMLFHLQGGEGNIQVPLMVVSLFVSMLYPLILTRLIQDS